MRVTKLNYGLHHDLDENLQVKQVMHAWVKSESERFMQWYELFPNSFAAQYTSNKDWFCIHKDYIIN